MSWLGAFLGLGIALLGLGLGMIVGAVLERVRVGRDERQTGVIGVGAILVVIGAVIMGAVLGV